MILTGENILSLPDTHKLRFVWDDVVVSSYAPVYFGLTGENTSLSFKMESGKVFDPLGRYVYSYRTGSSISIDGIFEGGSFRYGIDDKTVVGRGGAPDFTVTGWYLNTTDDVAIQPSFYTPAIDYDIILQSSFAATKFLSGTVINNSEVSFTVKDYSIVYYHNDRPDFSGYIYGKVPSGSSFGFLLKDTPQLLEDQTFKFYLTLKTNVGDLSKMFTVSRVSGFNGEQHILVEGNEPEPIISVFSGSGGANIFKFQPTSGYEDVFLSYNAYDTNGNDVEKTAKIQFYPVLPTGTGYYTGNYLTGFGVTSSGRYQTCPVAKFSGYYHVEDIDFVTSGILMSSGCLGDIPFYGVSVDGFGAGLTGHTLGKTISISGVYDNGTYYVVTGFAIENSGTGYTQAPTVKLQSGAYANCKDVPAYFGSNQWLFEPFDATAVLGADAAYLSGETICFSGSGKNYYQVSGITYTNVGSGYDQTTYVPRMHFERAAGDAFASSGNATGKFYFNTTASVYSQTGFWEVFSGRASETPVAFGGAFMSLLSGYTGVMSLGEGENDFVIRVYNRIGDYPSSTVLRLIVTPEAGESVTFDITGQRTYSTDLGHLKKNLVPSGDLIFEQDEELSFFMSNEESVAYYDYDEEGFIYE